MIVHEYIISALGHLADGREQDLSRLPRRAVEEAGRLLDMHGTGFRARLPVEALGEIDVRWTSEDFSCARAEFLEGDEILRTDAILSGLRPDADRRLLDETRAMVEDFCLLAGEEPSGGLLGASKRPAVVCIRWSTSEREGMKDIRRLELCLAAAFLKRAYRTAQLLA